MTISRSELSHEHATITAVADQLSREIDAPALDVAEVVRLRWRLSHSLAVHLAKEDNFIYPELKRSADARLAHLAAMFERELGGLRDAYRRYMVDWDGRRIAAEPAAFVAETKALLALLARRAEREESDLYPMYEAVCAAQKKGLPDNAGSPSLRTAGDQRRS